jgi:hypothetical protein
MDVALIPMGPRVRSVKVKRNLARDRSRDRSETARKSTILKNIEILATEDHREAI